MRDSLNKGGFLFQIGVHRKGYDMLVSNYWEEGSEEELKAYFKRSMEDRVELKKIRDAVLDLSHSVDEKMD